MKTDFKKSFLKDIKNLNDKKLKQSIQKAIEDVKKADSISQIDILSN